MSLEMWVCMSKAGEFKEYAKSYGVESNFTDQLMLHLRNRGGELAPISQAIGLNKNYLNALKRGRTVKVPSTPQVEMLATALGCTDQERSELVGLALLQRDDRRSAERVGKLIQRTREDLGLDAATIAVKLGINESDLLKLEEGTAKVRDIAILHVIAVLKYFGASEHAVDSIATEYGLYLAEVKSSINSIAELYVKGVVKHAALNILELS